MSPIASRAPRAFLLALLTAVLSGSVAACGGGGMSQSDIEQKINAAAVGEENVAAGAKASELAQTQVDRDADARAAEEARQRRKELEQIAAEQEAEAKKVLEGEVERDDPVDLEEQRFRARVAGVCDGAFERITKVSKQAESVGKSKDPEAALAVAKEYNDALGDFLAALKSVNAPPTQAKLYGSWLSTIDDLSNTIRLQLVSVADPKEYARLQKRTESLTTRFITQTAQLGVTCLSVSS